MERLVLWCVVLLSVVSFCHASCTIYEHGVSKDDKEVILRVHNHARNLIMQGKFPGQPKGKNLKTLKYDEKLAKKAQEISDDCVFAHQTVRDNRWHAVGQNLYTSMSTAFGKGADWKAAIQSWIDEHEDYSYGGRSTGVVGHYTQVVWGDTEYVGCGYTFYKGNGMWKYKKLYTCNYGPAGNYVGQLPYTKA